MRTFLLIVFALCVQFSSAQKVHPKESSVVRDPEGTILPFTLWRALVVKGDFMVKPVDENNEETEFQLVKLTEFEKNLMYAKMPPPKESPFFKTGQKFHMFNTLDINGNVLNAKTLKGKIVVINFWFVNCPPCRMEIPELNGVVDSFSKNPNVVFIAVALDRKDKLEEFLKTMPFKYQIVDAGSFIAQEHGIKGYPTHVIIDPNGKVAYHTMGFALNTVRWLKKSITELVEKHAQVNTAMQ